MNLLPPNMQPYAKAAAAFIALLVPFLTVLGTSLTDGQLTLEEVTSVVVAGGALVGGTTAVFQVKNKPTTL